MQRMKALLLLLLCLMLVSPAAAEESLPLLQLHQINLGFADGYLLRCGDIDIVIDGGDANPEWPDRLVLDYLRAAGVKDLDALIVTHWHMDHCLNTNLILEEFGNEDTMVYSSSARVFHEFSPLKNGTYKQLKTGDVLRIGPMKMHIVGPQKLGKEGRQNSDSLNFVLEYGSRRIFFTGDFAASGNILGEYRDICADVDVLKFPHHGMQPYEIGEKATAVVSPEYVLVPGIISKKTVQELFASRGVKISQENVFTPNDGNVVMLTDGERLAFYTQVTLSPATLLELEAFH